MVAVVALVISLQSLRTSERSLKIGQRAYVSISNGALHISEPGSPWPHELSAEMSVVINNLGNTPARFRRVSFTYVLPEGWQVSPPQRQAKHSNPDELGLKSKEPWTYIESFDVTDEALRNFRIQAESIRTTYEAGSHARKNSPVIQWETKRSNLQIKGDVTYFDVFECEHHLNWCWDEDPDSRYPKNCQK